MKTKHHKSNWMKTALAIALLLVIVVWGFYIGYTYVQSYKVYKVISQPMKLEVTENSYVGFAVGKEFNLGKVGSGQQSQKDFSVGNPYTKPLKIVITIEGDITQFLEWSAINFTLNPNETKKLSITVNTPENATSGNYTGNLTIYYYRW